jgi:hypothetical protein
VAGAVAAYGKQRSESQRPRTWVGGLGGYAVVAEPGGQSCGTPARTGWPGSVTTGMDGFGAFGPVVVWADGDRESGLDRGVGSGPCPGCRRKDR